MLFSKKYLIKLSCLLITAPAFSQNHFRGLDFEDNAYSFVKKKPRSTRTEEVPAFASVKLYAPIPKNQGQYGTCTVWATAYCASTIVNAIKAGVTDKDSITNYAYSPAFLFRLIKPKDINCSGSSSLMTALKVQKEQGNLPMREASAECIPAVSQDQIQKAVNAKLKDYARLFDVESPAKLKIYTVKKSLSEKKPVVIGMVCPPSFDVAKEIWKPKPTEQPDRKLYGGHAMCVVGYDDNKDGGSFEIQNSWGDKWGNGGYTWVNYETFAAFTMYGFEIK